FAGGRGAGIDAGNQGNVCLDAGRDGRGAGLEWNLDSADGGGWRGDKSKIEFETWRFRAVGVAVRGGPVLFLIFQQLPGAGGFDKNIFTVVKTGGGRITAGSAVVFLPGAVGLFSFCTRADL